MVRPVGRHHLQAGDSIGQSILFGILPGANIMIGVALQLDSKLGDKSLQLGTVFIGIRMIGRSSSSEGVTRGGRVNPHETQMLGEGLVQGLVCSGS